MKLSRQWILVGGLLWGAAVGQADTPATAPATPPVSAPTGPATVPAVAPGQAASGFTLKDVDGKERTLGEFKGQNLALFFFCGCRLCHKCARAWNEVQRGGALVQNGKTPPTLVVFHGDAAEARTFAEETQLDTKYNILLCDADEKVTQTYQSALCPRVFVIDGQGVIRYTNNEQGEDSYKIPAPLITARAVDALRRAAETAPPKKNTPAPAKPAKPVVKPAVKPATKPVATTQKQSGKNNKGQK